MMTDYVATRWYRAPELLLNTKHYDGAGSHFKALTNFQKLTCGQLDAFWHKYWKERLFSKESTVIALNNFNPY
jgi:hypothetical protein